MLWGSRTPEHLTHLSRWSCRAAHGACPGTHTACPGTHTAVPVLSKFLPRGWQFTVPRHMSVRHANGSHGDVASTWQTAFLACGLTPMLHVRRHVRGRSACYVNFLHMRESACLLMFWSHSRSHVRRHVGVLQQAQRHPRGGAQGPGGQRKWADDGGADAKAGAAGVSRNKRWRAYERLDAALGIPGMLPGPRRLQDMNADGLLRGTDWRL